MRSCAISSARTCDPRKTKPSQASTKLHITAQPSSGQNTREPPPTHSWPISTGANGCQTQIWTFLALRGQRKQKKRSMRCAEACVGTHFLALSTLQLSQFRLPVNLVIRSSLNQPIQTNPEFLKAQTINVSNSCKKVPPHDANNVNTADDRFWREYPPPQHRSCTIDVTWTRSTCLGRKWPTTTWSADVTHPKEV